MPATLASTPANLALTPTCARRRWRALACVSLLAGGLAGVAIAEQPAGPPPTVVQRLAYNFGSAGLLAEFASYEMFGTVQARLGQSRAQIEMSHLPGAPTTGYEDSAAVGVLPFDLIFDLPAGGGRSFLKFGGVANFNRGDTNLTYLDIDTLRPELQYLYAVAPDTLLGLGVIFEDVDVKLRHNGGTIANSGYGVRADVLHRINRSWGVAARAEHLWSEGETRLPLGGGMRYACDQDSTRLYTQADVVGTFVKESASWVPAGWVFRPQFGAVWQHNRFADATDSFGGTVSGTVGRTDDYALLAAYAGLESMDFRPWHLAPFFKLGLEQEITNDLAAKLDEPTILHSAVGAAVNLGHGARLDIIYARHDGLKGLRRDHALTVHFGLVF